MGAVDGMRRMDVMEWYGCVDGRDGIGWINRMDEWDCSIRLMDTI
jgi:hypothetical protein